MTTDSDEYPTVYVVGAPNLPDFTGYLLYWPVEGWPEHQAVVGRKLPSGNRTTHHISPQYVHRHRPVSNTEFAERVRDMFQRTWSCEVFTSGRHNGATCEPGDPHGGWNCGYYWTLPLLNDTEAAALGLRLED